MKFLIFVSILISMASALNLRSRILKVEDINKNIQPYIIGGRDVTDGEAPWQVAVQNNLPQYLCGGTILSEQWIATAAQCTTELSR